MKPQSRNLVAIGLALGMLLCGAAAGLSETVSVTIDPGSTWFGYMNVFELPANGGGYLWGSSWGAGDLPAVYTGDELRLSPNTNCYNAADPYWVNLDGSGNKQMEANLYVEDTSLVGKSVSFAGQTLANTLVPGYTAQAFIKVLDPALGWAVVASTYVPLVGGEYFGLFLNVPNTPGLIPQYGVMTTGAVANPATVDALGFALLTAPEPASLALSLVLGALVLRRR